MLDNFWSYLLEGIISFFNLILLRLPVHVALGMLGWASAIMAFALVPLLVFVGAFFDLRLMAVVAGAVFSLEIVRAIIALWRWTLSLIPAAS